MHCLPLRPIRNAAYALTLALGLLSFSFLSGCGGAGSGATSGNPNQDIFIERDFGQKIPILVSTFEPMGGRPQNNSEFIGDLLPEYVKSFRIIPCPSMPVQYDAAPARLIQCFEANRDVRAVISLGEASDAMEIERFATNLDNDGYSDNNGVVRTNQVILPTAPAFYELPLSPATLIRFPTPSNSPVRVRYDDHPGGMGNFIGNHTAFKFMHYLKSKQIPTPYGFVHVPHAMDPNEGHNPYEVARAIGAFFEKSLKPKLRPVSEI